ncbi:MAG: GlxA family transcriptional regulator [Candidatus Eisenbacteria bacterium]|uniref:GlxA family transcriptional regulator n=1 Tax=Eiseniibacteriota bacterium TaxID=2212470 RepID=A0A849SIJ8_UNCEI|nr:GlxA family transcriptional regulator [Candidatus Eisenbacteria bacterium]
MKPRKPRRIAMLAFPDAQILDVTGPLEVFARASRWLRDHGHRVDDAYQVEIIGLTRGWIRTSSGLRLHADHGIAQVGRGIDTLLIAGGVGVKRYRSYAALLRWIRRQSTFVRRLASICTGAFLLAEAGLLAGRRATTHWSYCASFAGEFPGVRVEHDTIFVRDGAVYTSAGVTAGMDLALALVEEDFGREAALATARELVMFLKRPGGQAQFSAQLAVQLAEHEPLRDLQAYIQEHPDHELTIERLARRVSMSPRNFARVFTRQVGATPARFVTSVRVETARRLLEETTEPLEAVCAKSGLGTPESMRRAFLSALGVPPGRYRERFSRSASVAIPNPRASRATRRSV